MLPQEYAEGFDVQKALAGERAASIGKDLFIGLMGGTLNEVRRDNAQFIRALDRLKSRLQQETWVRRVLEDQNYLLKQALAAREAEVQALQERNQQLNEELAAFQVGLENALTAAHDLFTWARGKK